MTEAGSFHALTFRLLFLYHVHRREARHQPLLSPFLKIHCDDLIIALRACVQHNPFTEDLVRYTLTSVELRPGLRIVEGHHLC